MNVTYAGAGQRIAASLIDWVILIIIFGLPTLLISVIVAATAAQFLNLISNILSIAISLGYYVFYQKAATQTLGKKTMGIRVVDAQGNTPSLMTFFLREIIGKMVSAIILMIGYLMILWDGRKQGLHDKIAGTFVVKVQPETTIQPPQQPAVQPPHPISQTV